MNKSLIILITSLFISTLCFSQAKGYIAISVGSSVPNGDFGSKDINNQSAGLANTGAIFDITFAHRFGKNLGITALLRGQANPVDAQPLIDELSNQNPTVFWTAESGDWGIGGLLVGIYGSFPLGKGKTTFDTRAMVGYLNATSPNITLTGTQGSSSAWAKLNSASASDFSYLLGAGFNFGIGKKVRILTNIDYLGSSPEFRNVKTTTSQGTFSESTFTQSFGTVNFSVGIGLRI